MNSTEIKLAKKHNRKYCILVGNGTTALYLSILSQGFENKKIAVPNNVCMNVVLAIYFSNNIPIFLDIEKDTLGLDTNLLKKENVDAVIGVHAYGNICDIEELELYCKRKKIFLIEDLAVAQGLFYNGNPLGSFGDVSILSFGSGKVVDIEHGGVILTDNKEIYDNLLINLTRVKNFEIEDENQINFISKKHTKLYNIDYGKNINNYHSEFKKLCLENQHHFLSRFNNSYLDKLEEKLSKLEDFIKIRQSNASYLNKIFKGSGIKSIQILNPIHDSSFWRFNIFIEKYRDQLFSYLLSKKYKVSSWYHSIDLLFEERKSSNTPNSDWVGKNIINIWVNEEIDKKYLDDISKDIINFLKEKECQQIID